MDYRALKNNGSQEWQTLDEILHYESNQLGYEPRAVQKEAISVIDDFLKSTDKFLVLQAPTASGKSLIAKTIAEFTKQKGKGAIITISNQLINQYKQDFKKMHVFWGKPNYECKSTGLDCALGSLVNRSLHQSCKECPYQEAKKNVFSSPYTIYNPLSWYNLDRTRLSDSGKKNCLLPIEVLVIDEAHELGGFLASLGELTIWERDIKWVKGIAGSVIEVIKLFQKFSNELNLRSNRLIKRTDQESLKELVSLKYVIEKLGFLIKELESYPKNYIVEETEEYFHKTKMACLKIRPIVVPHKVLNRFFWNVKKVIFMSGTMLPIHMKELQIYNYGYYELASPIPVKNRKIKIIPKIDCSYSRRNFYPKEVATEVLRICNSRPNSRGLVLTSYKDVELLKEYLTDERFVFNSKLSKKKDLEKFLKLKENDNRVGIFAASNTGLDLKNELCKFIIIPKVQLPSWGDTLVKLKAEQFKKDKWYSSSGMLQLIQGSARGCRHENDFCEIFVLDKNFNKYYNDCKELLPNYFKESIIYETASDK